MTYPKRVIGMIIFPRFTQLDFTAPFEVFSRLPNVEVLVISTDLSPVYSDTGLGFLPTSTFKTTPKIDILFVPGGPGVVDAMQHTEIIDFLKKRGQTVQYITSVCTGALVLGAAGLLKGYCATTHWMSLDLLPLFGAIAKKDRVVIDRNRITGGGVTAGIDFGLTIAATLYDETIAQQLQLWIEYNPSPPFNSGHPDTANPSLVAKLRDDAAQRQAIRKALILRLINEE